MTFEDMAALEAQCFPNSKTWNAEQFRTLKHSESGILVSNERGFVCGRVAADETEIVTLAVDPEFRRDGVGRSLLKEFELEAASANSNSIVLEVASDNTAALSLYNTAGFLQVGLRKSYYLRPDGSRQDALILKKLL